MEGQPQITILHLSDLQFGKHHRFAGVDLTGLPNPYDTLLARLWDDLQRLRKDHRLQPDLVIITGDLVEWGMPDEFRVVREFLEKLTDKDHLNLPRQRIAIIPGNHDINRKACHAYFLNCEASGTPVTPPWWPKWQFYASMFAEFYRDAPGVTFVPEQPWTLFEVPELKVVIAGLNSTMVEGHDCQESGKTPDPKFPRHVGICSEPQYRWFAERLAKHREEGWLRLGAVHHNQQRKCKDDEENLEDADTLEQVLGPSLNLLLHGHTHEAKLAWLDQHTPIISTGSAALDAKVRPAEIPNQYQILQVSPCVLRRFGRAFFPASRTFGADARVGKNDGLEEKTVLFVGVSGAFPGGEVDAQAKAANPNSRWRRSEDLDTNRPTDNYRRDDFLARVAEVCKFRRPAAAITPVHCGLAVNSVMDYLKLASSPEPDWQLGAGLDYLRVVERSDTIVRQYPVGVFQHGFTGEDLARFVTFVDAPYRACDSGLISEIVYSGERPAEEVFREAWRRSIRLQSFAEYQGLIDFTPYVQKQTDKLERDTIYPPSLYVPQRMRYHFGEKEEHTEDAFAQVQEWLIQPHPRFVLILGDFGTGKTFLLHELARRLGRDGTGLTPLFVELRALEKAQSLDALVAQHLAKSGEDRIDLPAFRYMLQQGRIVLFFDGFDELALRVSYDRAAEHFDTLIQAAAGDAKVVVTSRTQHFESDRQVRTVLYDRAQPLPGLRYCKLQPFTEHQIKLFLRNRWQDEREAEHWFGLITHVKDLLGLSENPRMLGFITELRKEDIAKAKQREGVISAADLYRLLLEKWLNFEDQRAHPKGAQVVLPASAGWSAANTIALRLWENT